MLTPIIMHTPRFITRTLLVLTLCFTALPAVTEAALPAGFSLEVVAGGLNLPTTFDFAPGNRIFVAEKGGVVRVIQNGELLPTPFYTLPNINTWADRGLIGLAVDPHFAENGWVYLSYTYENSPAVYEGPKMAQIVRVKADASGNVAIPGSMEVLVGSVVGDATTPSCNSFATGTDCIPSDSPSHSAGGLRFGPDGKLWATIGDGASFAFIDPNAYKAQDPDWLLGKVLRLNTDGTAPTDNPFYDGDPTSNRSKVYAMGLRNSFRFNFRPTNDSLYAGEVGWGGWEEINVIEAGDNLGWPCREGLGLQGGYQCTAPGAKDPLYTYANNGGASIVGGAFAGAAYPAEYQDNYFFGDFYRSQLSRMVISADDTTIISNEVWLDGNANGPVSIQVAPDGSIYYAAIYTGDIVHLKYTGGGGANQAPTARDDDATTLADQVTYIELLENDTDPEDDPLTLDDLGAPDFGAVYNNGDNTVTYVPALGFTGVDQFTYTVSDAGGLTDSAVVTVDVRPYGDPTLVDITHVSLTQSVQAPVLGETVTFSATVQNDGEAGSFLMLFDLYRADTGARVTSKVFNNEYIEAGATRTFTWSWTPQSEGPYWLSVGYLSPDWSILHHWEDKGLQFTVLPRKPTEPADLVIDGITLSEPAITLGEEISATVTIRNIGGAGSGLIDIEVTDETNTVVHMEFFDNEPFTVGEVRTFTTTWTPEELGHYYVDAGTFDAGWAQFQRWMWHGAEFAVTEDTGTSAKYVYNDTLTTDWASWSWSTDINFADTTSPYQGTNALSVTYNEAWGGVYFRASAPFVKQSYTDLSLAFSGSSTSGQDVRVKIIDPTGAILTEAIVPTLTSDWSEFSLSLASLADTDQIAGIFIMGNTGGIVDPYLVDEVRFE